MIIQLPRTDNVMENDIIVLTKNDHFIGYGTVLVILDFVILVNVDEKVNKIFNELRYEEIEFSFEWI